MALSSFYIYLISSLPMLQFGMKPPFSFERFLETASRYIPDRDVEVLKKSSISGEYDRSAGRTNAALRRWQAFDIALRNELVKARAARKRLDPSKFIRDGGYAEAALAHLAQAAHRNPSPLEAEEALDEARWRSLDELERGHYFDPDFLVIYAHKLLILLRWERINGADSGRLIEELV